MPFILSLIFLIFYFVRPQDFIGGVISGERAIFIILALALAVWLPKTIMHRKPLISDPKDIFVLAFFLACVISTISVGWAYYTISMIMWYGKPVLLYLMIRDILDSKNKLFIFMWAMVICVFAVGIMGILQYCDKDITGVGPFVFEQIKDGQIVEVKRIRGVGLFDTNQLAYLMGFMLPFAYALFRITRFLVAKIFLLAAFGVYGLTVYMTLSRGGALGFIVAGAFLYFLRKGATKKLLGMTAVGFFVLFLISTPTRLGSIFAFKEDPNSQGRLIAWFLGSQAWKNSPVIGIGVQKFTDTLRVAAHNAPVQIITETGLIGLFCWVGCLYFCFLSLVRMINKYQDSREKNWIHAIALCFLGAFFQFLVSCSFSNSGAYNFYVFIYIGMILALERLSMKQGDIMPERESTAVLVRLKDITRIAFLTVGFLIFWKAVLAMCLA